MKLIQSPCTIGHTMKRPNTSRNGRTNTSPLPERRRARAVRWPAGGTAGEPVRSSAPRGAVVVTSVTPFAGQATGLGCRSSVSASRTICRTAFSGVVLPSSADWSGWHMRFWKFEPAPANQLGGSSTAAFAASA
ncbi:hypothetical protein STENM223S_05614 [Streptomyces tendae]